MGLWKSILAKAANLLEYLLGKCLRVSLGEHAGNQSLTQGIDHTGPTPSSHRAAELIGLARRKSCRHNSQSHCLLLKQGDTERLF